MALRTFASAVGGGSGNGTAFKHEGGDLFFVVTAGSSFTSTTMTVQYSDDGTNYYTMFTDTGAATLAVGKTYVQAIPSGFVRVNFTGGSGTGITVKGKNVTNRRLTEGVTVAGGSYSSNTVTNS